MQRDGEVDLIVTGCGAFQAQLTRIGLLHIRVLAGTENLARTAVTNLPSGAMRVRLPERGEAGRYVDGVSVEPGELLTHLGAQRLHERTEGPCQWRDILLPVDDLLRYGQIIAGGSFMVPPGTCRWRPKPESLGSLTSLYDAAIRANKQRPLMSAITEAARGLENDLIDALIGCMRVGTPHKANAIENPCAAVLARFGDLIRADPFARQSTDQLCAALGVARPVLEACCEAFFGVDPCRFRHLRRLRAARRALRDAGPGVATVTEVVIGFGFHETEMFEADYHELFGERPVTTLRRGVAP